MFKNTKLTEENTKLTEENKSLQIEVEALNKEINCSEQESKIFELETKYKFQKIEKELFDARGLNKASDEEIAQKIHIAVSSSVLELQIEKNTATTEAAILNKAFENMGFDVKDMKDILGKLVDGLVSKNEITVIK